MLVLSRKQDEKIIIGDAITLMVVSIQGDKVRLGIEAPKHVSIHREEVYQAIQRERRPQEFNGAANPQQIIELTIPQENQDAPKNSGPSPSQG